MPRPIPTPAGVIFQHAELSKKIDVNINPYNALIARPNVYNTLEIFETQAVSTSGSFQITSGQTDGLISNDTLYFWLSPDFVLADGTVLYSTVSQAVVAGVDAVALERLPASGLYPQSGTFQDISGGVRSWSGDWTAISPALSFKTTQNVGGAINISVTPYYLVGGTWVSTASSVASLLNANNVTDVPVALPGETGATETALLVELTAPSFDVLRSLSFVAQTRGTWTKSEGDIVVTKTYSLFDLIGYDKHGVSALEQQYRTANRHCVTGFSCCVTNTTADIYKGGSIAAAQLPGDSLIDLPDRPEQIKSFLASRNDGKVYTGMLKRGAHYSYIPEKVQDLFFVREGSDDDLENFHLPFGVMAWEAAPIDGNNTLSILITIKMNVELITTDLSVSKFQPSQDLAQVHEIVTMLMQGHNPMSENPDHMAKVKKIAKNVVTHPMFKKVVGDLARAGMKAAPSLLALL